MEQPNKSYIHSLSGGDTAFAQKLIDIIKNEFPTEKEVYFNNMVEKKYKPAADNVHKLKHKISILGLEKSYETAVVFENNLLKGNIELKSEFESILTTITNYLHRL
jgi:HPt (histidine-containing phosphotransfer) domain-containing protein